MNQSLQVDVQVATEVPNTPDSAEIQYWLDKVVEFADTAADGDVEISVKLVDEEEGRSLNRRFRDEDSATNVLSFPLADCALLPAGMPQVLGDIVICAPVVKREADEQGKTVADHWAHMLVHGALHLLGYDHESEPEARQMETLEARILASRGVGNPYD